MREKRGNGGHWSRRQREREEERRERKMSGPAPLKEAASRLKTVSGA